MKKIIVVDHPRNFLLDVPGVEVVSARKYLTTQDYARQGIRRVFNLCRDYAYLTKGYYVSLLAEARRQKVIPSVKTIIDLKTPPVVRILSADLDELIQKSFQRLRSDEFILSIYFGENTAKQYLELSRALYRQFQAPLLRARFVRQKRWALQHIRAIGMDEIPDDHIPYLQEAAVRYFSRKHQDVVRTVTAAYDLAILVNDREQVPPSNAEALRKFSEVAEEEGFSAEFITRDDYARLAEFDALLIRETTEVNHHTYRFARRAQSEGLAVMDDPESILRCANKVYLAELLQRAKIPTPGTLIVHSDNRNEIAEALGLPCVLKLPNSSSSQGVVKVKTGEELQKQLDEMLAASDLVIAQAYMPTDFDWRIGVLDEKPLFACKYFMAKNHWQIYNWKSRRRRDVEGGHETVPISSVPAGVLDTALKAAGLIGYGLYGVDLKEIDGKVLVIEVNDNPTIDAGVEDELESDAIYRRVIRSLKSRLETQRDIRHGA